MKRYAVLFGLLACRPSTKPNAGGPHPGNDVQSKRVDATSIDTTFTTLDHFIASLEMQISGEPLAETMGRDLGGYSRDAVPSDQYFDPEQNGHGRVDVVGFSSA